MDINLVEAKAEVEAAFNRYEQALIGNDIATLDELFWESSLTIRYGIDEVLYGHAEISEFRSARSANGLDRKLSRTVITTYGTDYATTMTLFHRKEPGKLGRQSQTWVRMPEGWRIVAAHVSVIDVP
jgi:hypothetical protein